MTFTLCMLMGLALMCKALASALPRPHLATIEEGAIPLGPIRPPQLARFRSTSHPAFDAGAERKPPFGPGTPVHLESLPAGTGVRLEKAVVVSIIDWVCLGMTIISACFMMYDVVTHGIFFRGSALPLALTIAFPLLSSYADRRLARAKAASAGSGQHKAN